MVTKPSWGLSWETATVPTSIPHQAEFLSLRGCFRWSWVVVRRPGRSSAGWQPVGYRGCPSPLPSIGLHFVRVLKIVAPGHPAQSPLHPGPGVVAAPRPPRRRARPPGAVLGPPGAILKVTLGLGARARGEGAAGGGNHDRR